MAAAGGGIEVVCFCSALCALPGLYRRISLEPTLVEAHATDFMSSQARSSRQDIKSRCQVTLRTACRCLHETAPCYDLDSTPAWRCRHSEQVGGCVRLWGAVVGDVHWPATLERPQPHADLVQRHHTQEEAAIPARHATTAAGTGQCKAVAYPVLQAFSHVSCKCAATVSRVAMPGVHVQCQLAAK